MSHAADRFVPAANSGFTHVARNLVVVAALVALVPAAARLGGPHGSAISPASTSMPAATLPVAAGSGTDSSVPQASVVFSGREPATEDASPTF